LKKGEIAEVKVEEGRGRIRVRGSLKRVYSTRKKWFCYGNKGRDNK